MEEVAIANQAVYIHIIVRILFIWNIMYMM
jgi:hypothetical protein